MAKNLVPALDTTGWQDGIAQRAERLFAYWLTSEVSQSNNYPAIQSLPAIIRSWGNRPNDLPVEAQRSLSELYVDYFEHVSVNITVQDIDEATSRQNLKIDLRVRDAGLEYSLAKLVETANNSIKKVKDLNKS